MSPRTSLIECSARARIAALLDPGSGRELLDPFAMLTSPWLPRQGIVPQSDDGAVVVRGRIDGREVLALALEGRYQGGSIGEVAGAKLAAALELALRDCRAGRPVYPVLLLESGGVRLQEANLGLAAIAEIQSVLVELRQQVPVLAAVVGMVGCFGGMSLVAALCTAVVMTRQGRLGMNGPEVIEQEAGLAELDAADRPLVWGLIGGEQRAATGLADLLIDDDAAQLRAALIRLWQAPPAPRSADPDRWWPRVQAAFADPELNPQRLRQLWSATALPSLAPTAAQATAPQPPSPGRGRVWFDRLRGDAPALPGLPASLLAADIVLGGRPTRIIAVVPDPSSPYPRARGGEVGLREAWGLARLLRQTVAADAGGTPRALLAVVDVPSQAYGRREEMLGLHLACAAAVDAWASARLAGHPTLALLVGAAMSGAFLAHGYQAQRMLALDDPGVLVHAMGRAAAARVTRRSVDDLDAIGAANPPMSYRIADYAGFGLLHALLQGVDAVQPSATDLQRVRDALGDALDSIQPGDTGLGSRQGPGRAASLEVRQRLAAQW